MAQDAPALREMTVADIIDAAIHIYRHNFAPMLGIAAVVQAPMMALQIAASYYLLRTMMLAEGDQFPVEDLVVGMSGFGIALVVAMILYPLGEAALAIAVSERYLGRPITVSGAYQAAFKYWGRVLWTTLLYWLWTYLWCFVGLIFLILPGLVLLIALLIRYMLAPAVIVVLENRSGRDGMRRSWELTKGHSWSVFATMAILVLMAAVATYGIAAPLQLGTIVFMDNEEMLLIAQLVAQVVQSTVTILLQPLWMIGIVLIYYDLRIRKEGFDLMMMAEALGAPPPPKAGPTAEAPLYPEFTGSPPTGVSPPEGKNGDTQQE